MLFKDRPIHLTVICLRIKTAQILAVDLRDSYSAILYDSAAMVRVIITDERLGID